MTLDWGDSDDDAPYALPANWEDEEARMLQERAHMSTTAASRGTCLGPNENPESRPLARGEQVCAQALRVGRPGSVGVAGNVPVLCVQDMDAVVPRSVTGQISAASKLPPTVAQDLSTDGPRPQWDPQAYAFGRQNRPPNLDASSRAIASASRTQGAQQVTNRYHPYASGPARGASLMTEGKKMACHPRGREEQRQLKQAQQQHTKPKNRMRLVVPRDDKAGNDDANDDGNDDGNEHGTNDGNAGTCSPQTAFGDPLVSLLHPEAWVNEIMSLQFANDQAVVFHEKGSPFQRPRSSSRAQSMWTFPFSRYEQVVKALRTESNPHAIEELAPTVVATLRLSSRAKDDSMRYGHIPPEMEAKLMPFQREGIKFILRRGGRALLGDEMGLGKTVQALGAVSAYRDEWPVMIICPSSLRESWNAAIQEWLKVPEQKIRVVHSGKDAEGTVFGTFQFLVISYGFLDKIKDANLFNILVVDESHALKDWTAKRTKVALPILKKAKRVILLTGTPALNRPKEIFTQLSAVASKANLKLKDFGERYCEGSRWDKYAGSKNLDELFALLHSSVMIRRLKKDVLSELPRKRRQKVFLGLDTAGKKQLGKLKEQMDESRAALISSILSGKTGAIRDNGVIMEVYKKTAEVKIKAVQEYVATLLETGEKFLIFAHHIALLDAIEHACNTFNRGSKSAASYIRIDGSTPAKQRADLVDRFQNNRDVQVAILSIKAAGVGLTLTAASTVVFSELTWVPGDLIQAEDRAHRIGQQSAVNVSFLMAKNSIDELIWNTIEQKLEQLGECLNGEQQTMQVASTTQRTAGQPSILSYLSQSQKGTTVD